MRSTVAKRCLACARPPLSDTGGAQAARLVGVQHTARARHCHTSPAHVGRRWITCGPHKEDGNRPAANPIDKGNTPLGYNLLSVEGENKCVITGYDPFGFDFGEMSAQGGVLVFPGSFYLWSPRSFDDITKESLELVTLMEPKINFLLIGCGERFNKRLDPAFVEHFARKGISMEAMDSRSAASTFNVLNAEDRLVAAALLPLKAEDPPAGYYPPLAVEGDPMLELARGRGGGGVRKRR